MIEFKAECGHTIRAKDDDAGKVVRCSYCGREAQVPEEEDELDFLLTEVERTGDFDPPRSKRRPRQREGGKPSPIRPRGDFNPFGVALKMCYAALIITVLIVVGKGVYKRVVVDSSPSGKEAAAKPSKSAVPGPAQPAVAVSSGRGLLATRLDLNQNGIYVTSVPRGAEVYIRNRANRTDIPILRDPNTQRCQAGETGTALELSAGSYEVAVTLQLTDPGLSNLPGYAELHEAIEQATEKDPADDKLQKYFIPHGQKGVSLGTLSDQSRVIVMHYDKDVGQKSWTPCTAMFLPAETPLSNLVGYLPRGEGFGFDDDAVRSVLSLKKVPPADQQYILDALRRIGMVPYRKDDRSPYQVFFIRLVEGTVSTHLLPTEAKKKGS